MSEGGVSFCYDASLSGENPRPSSCGRPLAGDLDGLIHTLENTDIDIADQNHLLLVIINTAIAQGNAPIALAYSHKMVERYPDDPHELSRLGYVQYLAGEDESCRRSLTNALELFEKEKDDVHYFGVVNDLARLCLRQRKLDDCETYCRFRLNELEISVRENGASPFILIDRYSLLGDVLRARGRFNDAASYYRAALG